jgi:hypothetical protein
MSFSKHGKFWYRKDSWRDYEKVPWHTISESSRRKVMKHLMPKPAVCPFCGQSGRVEERYGLVFYGDGLSERVLILVNRSGHLKRDLGDWYWTCRDCYHKEQSEQKQRYPIGPDDKLKSWSDLSRRGRVSRVRRDLPKPATCSYCDCAVVELVSRSGTWLEDLTDYTWCCRHHRYMIESLIPNPEPVLSVVIELLDPELFPHWTNSNSMAGSFKGHSIIGKTSAAGRFMNIEPLSFAD